MDKTFKLFNEDCFPVRSLQISFLFCAYSILILFNNFRSSHI